MKRPATRPLSHDLLARLDTPTWTRRRLLGTALPVLAGATLGCRSGGGSDPKFANPAEQTAATQHVQTLLDKAAADSAVPGVSLALVRGTDLIFRGAAGYADLEQRSPMTADTVQNIGSVSKTITAAAVMQCVEAGQLALDDDINAYLDFPVRNPAHPDEPITVRHLLIHRSSIKDGPAYDTSYACGDPNVNLADWIRGYFVDGGAYWSDENFHTWRPGTVEVPKRPRPYSNVAFGLLGLIVETVVGTPFATITRERIFAPLGMDTTSWHLRDIPSGQHATTYTIVEKGFTLDDGEDLQRDYVAAEGVTPEDLVPGAALPHCPYSFYNYPDGLLRTSVTQLSRFLRAHILGGQLEGTRILEAETVGQIFHEQATGEGLCWSRGDSRGGGHVWQHGGGDPGISTFMIWRERDQAGMIAFFNTSDPGEAGGSLIRGVLDTLS